MWIILIIISVIVMLILFCLYSRITIQIEVAKTGKNDRIDITVKFLRIFKKNIKIPFVKKEDGGIQYEKQSQSKSTQEDTEKTFTMDDVDHLKQIYQDFLKKYNHAKYHVKKLMQKVSVDRFSTDVRFGVGMADYTATLTALIWMVHSWIRLFMESFVTFRCKPVHNVVPLYGMTAFKMNVICIVSIRLGHLMIIGIRMWLDRGMPKQKKVGEFHGASH